MNGPACPATSKPRTPGVPSDVEAENARLRREVAELRKANEILKAASIFFAKELDHPSTK